MGHDSDHQKSLQAIAAGDREAFAGLMRRFQRPLFSFLGRMGLDQGRAEDIAQETFLKVWTQAHRYDATQGQPGTWLFAMARNLALNHLASASHRLEASDDEYAAESACEAGGPFDALDRLQQQRRLIQAMRRLPLDDRSVLGLAYVQELDMAAIAHIENTTTGAVKTRLHRARQKLRALLEQDHE